MSPQDPISGAEAGAAIGWRTSEGGESSERATRPLTVLGVYPWDRFWSMGEFRGAPSFFLAPQSLVKTGHKMHVSMPGRGWTTGSKGPTVEDYHGMKLHRYRFGIDFMPMTGGPILIHLTRPFRYLYYVMLATAGGLRLAQSLRPDVVVGYGALGAPVAFLIARSMGLPNVTRLFGQSLSLGFVKGWKAKIKLLLNYPEVFAFLTPCRYLIVHNDGSGGDRTAARLGVAAERLRYWRNGLDKGLFKPPASRRDIKRELGLDPDVPMLLSASRLDKEKHHERLLRAMPDLLAEFPNARALIVGEGPERAYLEEEARLLGVSSAVRFAGAVSREELAEYYKACDVFLALSDRTNMGNPTDEAMSCGACVVALDIGDTSQAVRDNETGVLVREQGLGSLGAILIDLLKDESRREELGRRAARYADEALPSVEERQRMEANTVIAAALEDRPPR